MVNKKSRKIYILRLSCFSECDYACSFLNFFAPSAAPAANKAVIPPSNGTPIGGGGGGGPPLFPPLLGGGGGLPWACAALGCKASVIIAIPAIVSTFFIFFFVS